MDKPKLEIKLEYIPGLREVVLREISQNLNISANEDDNDFIYLDFPEDISRIKDLRSVARAHIIVRGSIYNPHYISKHKSIIGNIIEIVQSDAQSQFKSFKIICAGHDSPEVRSISKYIEDTYKLSEDENADMKVHTTKTNDIWETGVEITARPLSLRDYKERNMSGAMDPTIAYSLNSLCGPEEAHSYLNIFSGSATLLIEAGQCCPDIKNLVGFDNNKEHLSLAMQNIKKSGLITRIKVKEEDIFDSPELGKFDVITSDLPFGMLVSKYEDLDKLYKQFIEYCEQALNAQGRLGIYTNNCEMLNKIIEQSKFKIIKRLDLKIITSSNMHLYPSILICSFK